MRDAVFFLITPRLVALSTALYARGSSFSASEEFPVVIAFLTSFIDESISLLRRKLNTCLRNEARCAFFADAIIGIMKTYYAKNKRNANAGCVIGYIQ